MLVGGHIEWANVDTRLRALRGIWVATAPPGGRPDATPVWFWWDGERVYLTCAAVSRRARNIGHEPEVVLTNGDGADPRMYATVANHTDWRFET